MSDFVGLSRKVNKLEEQILKLTEQVLILSQLRANDKPTPEKEATE